MFSGVLVLAVQPNELNTAKQRTHKMNKPVDSLNVAVHPVDEPAIAVLTLPFSCNMGKYCKSILCYKLLLWNYYLSLGGYFVVHEFYSNK